jgi:hypothetical protein
VLVDRYYQAQGAAVCETCAHLIENDQQRPPATSLARAAFYGVGAAAAGCALYAGVAIVTGFEIGIIAIVVGVMVGKAVRAGSKGLGGRPQQILAVLLTYFAISTSYIPIFVHQVSKARTAAKQAKQSPPRAAAGRTASESPNRNAEPRSIGGTLVTLLMLAAAAPLLMLGSGVGAWISLFIIFIGLHRAWNLTGRTEVLLMGPYEVTPAA